MRGCAYRMERQSTGRINPVEAGAQNQGWLEIWKDYLSLRPQLPPVGPCSFPQHKMGLGQVYLSPTVRISSARSSVGYIMQRKGQKIPLLVFPLLLSYIISVPPFLQLKNGEIDRDQDTGKSHIQPCVNFKQCLIPPVKTCP